MCCIAPNLAWLDVVAVGGVAYLYYEALRQRRKVHPHSRYMLATVIFLIPPIIGRLSPLWLGLDIAGPQDFHKLHVGFQAANGVAAAIAFALAWHSGKHGRPFWIAGGLTLVAALLFETVGEMPAWEAFYVRAAELPTLAVLRWRRGWRGSRSPTPAGPRASGPRRRPWPPPKPSGGRSARRSGRPRARTSSR